MNIQDMVDGMNARMQRERAKEQMTLGKLIAALEALPAGATVQYIGEPHSYRGYYCDLAFELGTGQRLAADLLNECVGAMGKVFEGYKGGDFVMGAQTPVWIAEYGCCGDKIMQLNADGSFSTEEDA